MANKKSKIKKLLKIIDVILFTATIFFVILFQSAIFPRVNQPITSYDGNNQYITFDKYPLISAHRAGGSLAPENTLMAFEKCIINSNKYKVDLLEFDLHITKDNQLILLHDDTVDRTSNAIEFFGHKNVKACNKTLKQLKQLNMAENFKNNNGEFPYRGLRKTEIPNNCKILTFNELIEFFKTKNILYKYHYIIEIKNGNNIGKIATDLLYKKLCKENLINRVILGTFKSEITKYVDQKYPDLTRSAGIGEVISLYFSFLFGINLNKNDLHYKVLQIPYAQYGIDFGNINFIDYAHKYNLAVQFWTVNNANKIRKLCHNKADAIITDNPQLAFNAIYD